MASVATSAGLALGARSASAITASPCTDGYNCGPGSVTFWEPGAYPWHGGFSNGNHLDNSNFCGIVGSYSPLAATAVDQSFDDPAQLDTTQSNNGEFVTGENEGNYKNNEVFSFQPAQLTPNGTPDLATGSQITISLPRPTESYPDSGAVLPPSQINTASLESPETLGATISAPGAWNYDSSSAANSTFSVTVNLPAADAGHTITLSSLDPNNAQPATIPTAQSDGNVTINGYDTATPANGYDTGHQTVAIGTTAYFVVQLNGSGSATIVLAATDATSGNEIANTARVYLNGGNIGGGACSADLSAPTGPTAAAPYLLFRNGDNVGYPASAVTVSSSAGVESATIQVPPGLCPPAGCTNGDTIYVDVLDAVSPPGFGTQDNAAQSPLFPASSFTLSTSDDPVPSAPSTAPRYIGDFNDSQNITDGLCFPYSSSTSNLVDPCDSTLAPSTNSLGQAVTQVTSSSGNTVTTTLRDAFNNPVNDHQEEVFQTGATHAVVTPQAPPATQSNQNPAASKSGDDGTAAYAVTDSCAETVNLEGVDTSTNQPFPYSHSNEPLLAQFFPPFTPYTAPQEQFPAIQFTAGPAVAPDSSLYSPAQCTTPAVRSSVSVAPATVAADGASTALVTVTLGDQYGNTVPCQPVELIQPNATHATVAPLTSADPCPPGPPGSPTTSGPGYSGLDGKATFDVSDADVENVVFGVVASSSWPTDPVADPTDVAVVSFVGPDAGTSTVTASRTIGVPGNGFPSATVTVTLLDASHQPLQNKKVTLATAVADPTATITPLSATTNPSGQAVFTVSDDCATPAVNSCTASSPHSV
ncbi:MAG TPA: hypothetical protein VID75_05475, partial [Acidimicrobiales bacterium]